MQTPIRFWFREHNAVINQSRQMHIKGKVYVKWQVFTLVVTQKQEYSLMSPGAQSL